MTYLLDTHAFIWMDVSRDKLSSAVVDVLRAMDNDVYLSLVSVWEMQIKLQLGKLKLNAGLKETIEAQEETNQLKRLPIKLDHILKLEKLPHHHRDPFDRLLIAQTVFEDLTLITTDTQIQQYDVKTLW